MSMLKEIIKNKAPVHTRQISLSAVAHGPGRIIVHGELRDERRLPIIDILGRAKPPGTVHHMSATLLIAPEPLRIIQAEADMMIIPMDQCPETLDRMEKIVGLEVRPGFSQQIRSLVGGSDGCAHLCTLVKAMGTEIVHGWLAWQRHQHKDQPQVAPAPLSAADYLIDSCRMWKKDGPRHRQILEMLNPEK